MKIELYNFLDNMIGDIEVSIFERLDNGKDRHLFIGYPDELKEHLELSFSTTRYKVFYIQQVQNDILFLTVIEE